MNKTIEEAALAFDYIASADLPEAERNAKYPYIKVLIVWDKGGSERPWARRIVPGLAMLCNTPLDLTYRYGDLVEVRGDRVGRIVRRTFVHRYGFTYDPAETEAVDVTIREEIVRRIVQMGFAVVSGFTQAGRGYITTIATVVREDFIRVMTEFNSPITEIVYLDDDRKVAEVLWQAVPLVATVPAEA